jgi:hypothetical protein
MTPEQYESYRKTVAQGPLIQVSDLDAGDHTLTTGYDVDSAGEMHVYVMDEVIHVATYQRKVLLDHEQYEGRAVAHLLRPSKRAYPHTTNEIFALLMHNADAQLTFLGYFDWDQDWVRAEMAAEPFKAPTHLDF